MNCKIEGGGRKIYLTAYNEDTFEKEYYKIGRRMNVT